MTVPGASHKEQESQIHRTRHDKRAAAAVAGASADRQKFAGLYTGPYFDPAMPTNISVQLGDTALLICKVNQVGRKTVSLFNNYFRVKLKGNEVNKKSKMNKFKQKITKK